MNILMKKIYLWGLITVLGPFSILNAGVRLKDLSHIQGIQYQQLIGYGIVVGLNGTGDSKRAQFTMQSVVNMLQKFGVTVPREKIKLNNVAAVIVTAELPAFAREGDRLTVTVSSLGDAKSLEGGILLMTPLANPAGEVMALTQGPISVGGFAIQTSGGGGVRQNHPLVGRIPDGAQIQKSSKPDYRLGNALSYSLNNSDLTTTQRAVKAINKRFGDGTAEMESPHTFAVKIPEKLTDNNSKFAFLSELEQIEIQPDVIAKVVINERTGTVVIGGNVSVLPAAIAHGNLSVEINSEPIISQPAPFSKGQTVVVPNTSATVYQDKGNVVTINNASTVQEVAQALNLMGLTPRDIVAVMQALKEAGALQAELVIM